MNLLVPILVAGGAYVLAKSAAAKETAGAGAIPENPATGSETAGAPIGKGPAVAGATAQTPDPPPPTSTTPMAVADAAPEPVPGASLCSKYSCTQESGGSSLGTGALSDSVEATSQEISSALKSATLAGYQVLY